MRSEVPATHLYRFGLFEADARSGKLLRQGSRVKIQEQPFQVLLVLLRRAGEVVTREELRQELWPSDTYVEFDGSLNAALKKLRYALGDSADNPTFIETVTKRGYRFIAPVELVVPPRIGSEVSGDRRMPKGLDAPEPGFTDEAPGPARANGVLGLALAPEPEPSAPEPMLVPFPGRRKAAFRSRVGLGIGALVALALAGAGVYWLIPVPPPRVIRRVQLTHFGRADSASGMATDGARIFFSEVKGGRYSIDQVSVSGGDPTPFPLPFPNAEVFDISPDHTELLVASFSGLEPDEALWAVPVTGGPPRRLGDAAGTSGAWSPDGETIAYTRGPDLFTVRRDGNGTRRLVSQAPAGAGVGHVRWASSGRVLRFTALAAGGGALSQWEVSADGSNLHLLHATSESRAGAGEAFGSWTPDGKYFVYWSSQGARAWEISASRESGSIFRRFNRKPVEIYASPHLFYAPLPSLDGKRIFFIEEQARSELVRYDSRSRQFVPYLGGISAHFICFSRDGQRIGYTLFPDYQIWVSNSDGSGAHPLSFPPMFATGIRLSPDGRQVAFGAWGTGVQNGLYVLPAEAGGKPEQVLATSTGGLVGWTLDGQSLLFWQARGPEGHLGLYAVGLKSREVTMLPGSEGLHHGSLSPDGLRVAALEEGNRAVVLYDLQTHQKTELAKGVAVGDPYWSHDSRAVFFQDVRAGSDQPIYRVRIDDRKVERITNLAQPLATDVTSYRLTGATPDDQVLASLNRSNSDLYALDVDFP